MKSRNICHFVFVCAHLIPCGAYAGQCTAVLLSHQDDDAYGSFATAVYGNQQVGWSENYHYGGIWTGTEASFQPLYKDLTSPAYINDVFADQQVGTFGGWNGVPAWGERASLWRSTPQSYVNLDPQGALNSSALGTDGLQQVGYATFGSGKHAALWSGSAESFVDLHPSSLPFAESNANAVYAGHQVGHIRGMATMWSGTAESALSLHVAGAYGSEALDIFENEQVGYVRYLHAVPGIAYTYHASLWNGSPESWLDLSPDWALESSARGVWNGRQVGWASLDSQRIETHATIWSGNAASCIDLHAALPAIYTRSEANGIWDDGSFVYVVGRADVGHYSRSDAVMWILATPEPSTAMLCLASFAFCRLKRPLSTHVARAGA